MTDWDEVDAENDAWVRRRRSPRSRRLLALALVLAVVLIALAYRFLVDPR